MEYPENMKTLSKIMTNASIHLFTFLKHLTISFVYTGFSVNRCPYILSQQHLRPLGHNHLPFFSLVANGFDNNLDQVKPYNISLPATVAPCGTCIKCLCICPGLKLLV